ncbi:unnamed protein product [Prorocentrum cordatum]|uniref:Lysosomal dipeptide transporter MFSD1 n=1 Tax=Prorocentrum cordatum TaxID=2364126 RepID=A0ABN9VEU2_9DINO|nr:unnamed protein product [Polarella glacialis]
MHRRCGAILRSHLLGPNLGGLCLRDGTRRRGGGAHVEPSLVEVLVLGAPSLWVPPLSRRPSLPSGKAERHEHPCSRARADLLDRCWTPWRAGRGPAPLREGRAGPSSARASVPPLPLLHPRADHRGPAPAGQVEEPGEVRAGPSADGPHVLPAPPHLSVHPRPLLRRRRPVLVQAAGVGGHAPVQRGVRAPLRRELAHGRALRPRGRRHHAPGPHLHPAVALGAGLACAVGSLFTVLGFRWGLLRVMLLARCVFWLALNALLMVQTLLVYSIFKGKAVDVAYSLIVTACRLGGVLGYCLSGPMLGRCGLEGALWVSVGMVFLAFGATLLFAYLFRGSATARSVRPHLERRRSSRSPASSPRSQTGSVRPEPSEFSLRLLRSMPRSVLSLTFATGALYGTVFPFEVVANDMLQNEFRYDANSAGYLVTVIPAVSIFSPLLSQLLGTGVRCRLAWCCAGFVMLISAQLLICTWDPSVTIPCLALMGLGFAASVCSIWTTLPLLLRLEVPEEDYKAMEGLATSLGFSTLAVTQFISNLAVGALRDAGSYRAACAWLASVSSAGLLCLVPPAPRLPRAVGGRRRLRARGARGGGGLEQRGQPHARGGGHGGPRLQPRGSSTCVRSTGTPVGPPRSSRRTTTRSESATLILWYPSASDPLTHWCLDGVEWSDGGGARPAQHMWSPLRASRAAPPGRFCSRCRAPRPPADTGRDGARAPAPAARSARAIQGPPRRRGMQHNLVRAAEFWVFLLAWPSHSSSSSSSR